MARYLVNSAVLVGPGTYKYRFIDHDAAREWLDQGDYYSRVGYPRTADYLFRTFGVEAEINRGTSALEVGDEALVVRLKYRLENPYHKGQHRPADSDFELGLLLRLR